MSDQTIIDRPLDRQAVEMALERSQVVLITGPRQSGKTTLARQFAEPGGSNYFDLEDVADLSRLDQPSLALLPLTGTVVIDEVQRRPDLFPYLRVLADRRPLPARFLVLGSASGKLLRQSSESLAGRIETIHLSGLRLSDVGATRQMEHWRRGGFPRAFIAPTEESSLRWREQFQQTVLERDVPALGIRISSVALARFWSLIAHYHGQTWNGAAIARMLHVSEPSVRRYLDTMTDIFMLRQLHPWHENLGKRQVKAPKIYIRDTGLLHTLLGIRSDVDLQRHLRVGASWEGYAIEEIIKAIQPEQAYFWSVHRGPELDLLVFKHGRRIGYECKRVDAPRGTHSMSIALDNLRLDELNVVIPGDRGYRMSERINAVPLREIVCPK